MQYNYRYACSQLTIILCSHMQLEWGPERGKTQTYKINACVDPPSH